jgi:SAM-dependent methyltransferase
VQRAGAAFDREAPGYDLGFGTNPAGLVFRRVFQDRLLRVLTPGSRVLDVGCGTGEDALALAGAGYVVRGVDPSPAMVGRARAKAAGRGIPESRLAFDVRGAEDPWDGVGPPFDAACSDFGALNCADPRRAGEGMARALRPGARVVVSLLGRYPLPSVVHRLVTGRGEPRSRRPPRVAGVRVPVWYATPARARKRLGRAFEWRRAWALGVLVPGPDHRAWAERNPQLFGALAALEGLARGWPVLRGLGDHVVLEGVRR